MDILKFFKKQLNNLIKKFKKNEPEEKTEGEIVKGKMAPVLEEIKKRGEAEEILAEMIAKAHPTNDSFDSLGKLGDDILGDYKKNLAKTLLHKLSEDRTDVENKIVEKIFEIPDKLQKSKIEYESNVRGIKTEERILMEELVKEHLKTPSEEQSISSNDSLHLDPDPKMSRPIPRNNNAPPLPERKHKKENAQDNRGSTRESWPKPGTVNENPYKMRDNEKKRNAKGLGGLKGIQTNQPTTIKPINPKTSYKP